MDEALRFLEADPRCFRSGYLKEELMTALANVTVAGDLRGRLQGVVLHRLTLGSHGSSALPGDLPRTCGRVSELTATGTHEQREDAAAVVQAVDQKQRTVAGQRSKLQ